MTQTTTTGQTYYRTAKGSHRHAAWTCANSRRSIQLGAVTEIPAAEVSGWAPCEDCCDTATVKAATAATAAQVAAQCPNTGVRNPKHIQSECRDCGKRGTVNRSTGQLRAHKPAK
jgi:hypothetical protein